MASDEPSYKREQTPQALADVNAEVRLYDEVLIASVRVKGESWRDASSAAFRPLANYIFGANLEQENIGMTSPVTTHQIEGDGQDLWEVRFFMPPRYQANTLPRPQSPYVRTDKQVMMRFAAIRFSGEVRAAKGVANFAAHEAKLRDALRVAGIAHEGAAYYAVYNGPWTPAMLRRNEVLIALP